MTALLLPICLLAAAVFVDTGTLYLSKSNFQNAADAAALAGAQELPDREKAADRAKQYIVSNGVAAKDVEITFSDDGKTYAKNAGGKYCRVIYTAQAKSLVMSAIVGAQDIRVRATGYKEDGDGGYMIFANDTDPKRGTTTLTLSVNNAHAQLKGKIHSNGGLSIHTNNAEIAEDSIRAVGEAAGADKEKVLTGVPQEPMPDLSKLIEKYEQQPSRVYQGASYTGSGQGYDAIIATGDVTIYPAGNIGGPGKTVLIVSKKGRVIMSSAAKYSIYAIVYAPGTTSMQTHNGKIDIMLNNSNFYGSVIGGVVNMQVNYMEVDGSFSGEAKKVLRLVE